MKKIALIGSAPSSVQLGPYDDKTWQIWGCSPGAMPYCRRVDRWFELHRREPGQPWFHPEYVKWMAGLDGPVMVAETWPEFTRNGVLYPKDAMLERFGPYFFTSSLAWMFALAIAEGATEVGMWGVDMAAKEEWQFQRSGCQFFIWRAQELGIKVTLPPESDLWVPPPLYGFSECEAHSIKLMKRRQELTDRLRDAEARAQQAAHEAAFLRGACDDNEYHHTTWVLDAKSREMALGGPKMLLKPDPVLAEICVEAVAAQPNGIDTTVEHAIG